MSTQLSLPKETIHRLTGTALPGGLARNPQGGLHARAGLHESESFSSLGHTFIPTNGG
jgi:hypothetical protein